MVIATNKAWLSSPCWGLTFFFHLLFVCVFKGLMPTWGISLFWGTCHLPHLFHLQLYIPKSPCHTTRTALNPQCHSRGSQVLRYPAIEISLQPSEVVQGDSIEQSYIFPNTKVSQVHSVHREDTNMFLGQNLSIFRSKKDNFDSPAEECGLFSINYKIYPLQVSLLMERF